MPVRFTSPSLGGQRDSFFKKGEWQLSAAFRRIYADKWFVGHDVNEAAAPFGKQLYLDINSLDVTITYGLSRRASVAVTLPMSHGTHSRYYADGERHKVVAQGIGDVNAIGTLWLLEPNMHLDGNVALGFGVKTPNRREEMQLSRIFSGRWFRYQKGRGPIRSAWRRRVGIHCPGTGVSACGIAVECLCVWFIPHQPEKEVGRCFTD